jgi:alanine racemase
MAAGADENRWVEVNLDAIRHNYRQIRQHVTEQVKILSVVKADAYGHGAPEVARVLAAAGTDMLGVTTVAEGKRLREHGITAPILVFGPFIAEEAHTIRDYDLTATVASLEALAYLQQALAWGRQTPDSVKQQIKIHLKIETGLGRTGLWPHQVLEAAREIDNTPGLIFGGVYSHLATAMWRNQSYALRQLQIFTQVTDELEKAGFQGYIKHLANSTALLNLPQMHLDMVRAGTILYGQHTNPALTGGLSLQDPWSLQARVVYLRELPAGHSVGYGRTYITPRTTTVAVLPVGFADGFQVEPVFKPAGLGELLRGIIKLILQYLNYRRVTQPVVFTAGKGYIIGKAGMQMTMVDVTGITGVEIGSIAQLPARRTAVSPMIPRLYIGTTAE